MEEFFKEQIDSLPRPKSFKPGPPSSWSMIPVNQRILYLDKLQNFLNKYKHISSSSEVPEEAIEELGDNDIIQRPSAVNVVLLMTDDGNEIDSLLLMKRSMNVSHHKGQISFPGGMREEADSSFTETSLRETQEEIGVEPERFQVIGELNKVSTRSRLNLITPIVTIANKEITGQLSINKGEVEHIHIVKIDELLKPDKYYCEIWDLGDIAVAIHMFSVKDANNEPVFIWGATAQIIVDMLRCLN
ncbi:MAG: CoA pyrophosphatase [Acidimicrobiia bacterium]